MLNNLIDQGADNVFIMINARQSGLKARRKRPLSMTLSYTYDTRWEHATVSGEYFSLLANITY